MEMFVPGPFDLLCPELEAFLPLLQLFLGVGLGTLVPESTFSGFFITVPKKMVKAILITGIHDVKIFKKNTTFEG